MKNLFTQTTLAVLVLFAFAFSALANEPQTGKQSKIADTQSLEKASKKAQTSAEHRAVAQEFRSRADQFRMKAEAHDKEAEKLARTAANSPMIHKWPALAQAPAERERRLAMQYRRAAEESALSASRHEKLAAQGGSQTTAQTR